MALKAQINAIAADCSILLKENYTLIECLNPKQYKQLKIESFFTTSFPKIE